MPREFKTILCPTDFSDSSYHALEYGVRFARNAGGTLLLLHVIHVPAGDLLGRDAYTLNFNEAERQVIERLREVQAKQLNGYPTCELMATLGDPAEEIIGLARSRSVDLIISSTHGRSGLSHLVMGSVAEKIIRHAPCPVFVVRAGVE
jgi:nucleotide-binding universal stress UspA family protein